ncbi:MAG TPA: mycofactocin biosynthesis chaperone MftB [Microbacterium sp.]|jgi:putative mycofactocin binding protein MftB|uniref:mycofactocin biosynthesis chaperone MftB n=1 Tax=unclassified Microbacterium TaxID=2609290 RepID=UPI000C65E4F7|nr:MULTISPECIES: mycofactocin biosynthesis chaperone MftB [unclassified Microbacterium]MBU19114.1 mycofactocin biosynthesis chaperone MftB [Microbacterium sp.]HAM12365.1 mycofactocin biosynthesis chaperone MftB [Microbacterium sp.]HBS07659.1 mycofactocin biosynthesis chaperone MftB [Microbacterium sp.]HBU44075.1 mycofactocin biosynthesis chaperone MftB [Microbacterium sp.]HCM51391.1 mycofactocin biosynthesis chaperone MftB [Microbacterium sp.]|tara:strand:+ start:5207 stop:5473 length:267 start_codon:yes stop_codon:yes gene_type:complete
MDAQTAWRLHPQVSVRPESFGALLYHFGTRKLSFLKDRTLLSIVECLDSSPDVTGALDAAGVPDTERPRYLRALDTLAQSHMIQERVA